MLGIMAGMNQRDSYVATFWRTRLWFTTTGACGSDCSKTTDFPQLQSTMFVVISFVTQRLIPMVLVTMKIPQLQFLGDRRLCCAGRAGLLVSESHLCGIRCSPEEYKMWIFWEMTSGIISVFNTFWFDSGYSSASVYEAFWTFLLVWYRDRFPWSRLLWTTEFLQLLRKVIDVPGCRFSLLMRRGGLPWSRLLSDQRGSPVR